MTTTVEALQGLYVALGGNAEDVVNVVTIPDMIVAISNQVTANKEAENNSGD